MTVTVRNATERDAGAIAGVHVRAWHVAYRGVVPDEVLERFTVERSEATWHGILGDEAGRSFTLIAEVADQPVGFCAASTPSRDDDAGGRTAEVAATYVEPHRWRQGVGTALMAATLDELRRGQWQDVTLWVFSANDQAQAFYRRFGFEADGAERKHEPTGQLALRMRAELRRSGPAEEIA
jgi:GNAT superfamily N-acetyltransferase